MPTNTEINESVDHQSSSKDAVKNKKIRATKRKAEASSVLDTSNTTDDMLFQDALKVLHTKDDAYDTFGKHVASELRKYDPYTLSYVKKSIMDIIFEADMGRISRQSNYGYFTQQYAGTQYLNESSSSFAYAASTYLPTPSPQAPAPSPQATTLRPQATTPSPQAPTPSPQDPTPSPQALSPSPQVSTPSQLEALDSILNNMTDPDFS